MKPQQSVDLKRKLTDKVKGIVKEAKEYTEAIQVRMLEIISDLFTLCK